MSKQTGVWVSYSPVKRVESAPISGRLNALRRLFPSLDAVIPLRAHRGQGQVGGIIGRIKKLGQYRVAWIVATQVYCIYVVAIRIRCLKLSCENANSVKASLTTISGIQTAADFDAT